MSSRGVALQAGLAFFALLLAYFTWQRPPEKLAGEVFVLDITKNDLEKVRYEDQESKSWSELAKDKDDDGTFVSLRLSGYDSSGAALPSGHPGIPLKQPERLVRANDMGRTLFERFAPLKALRALGELDATRLKDFGLDKTKKSVEVTARGVKRRFALVSAPPGGDSPYMQDVVDKKVYIVPRQLLSDFSNASNALVEKKLHGFRIEEVDRLVVSAGGKKRELVASRIEDFPGVRLAPAETPDKPDATVKNWHDRIFGLFPSEMLGKGEVPTSGAPQAVLQIEYFSRGRRLGFIELARSATPPSATSSAKPPPVVGFARTEYTAGWAKLGADAATLMTEGETLVAKK